MSIISKAPYYDKYTREKQYTQLLAVPGRVAQARELTEIQSTMKDIIRSIGDSILNDGNIIEGCQVIPNKITKKATITTGKVYINGLVLTLPETTVDISGVGTEVIGVTLKESIVTSFDDPDLRDPALGYENFNQPGCDRLKSELVIVVVQENATDTTDQSIATLATLIDGEVSVEQQAPNYSALNETLARRTFDESGSYIVNGLTVRVEPNTSDSNQFTVVVEPGKAYVQGYELSIPSARRISLPRSMTSSTVLARYNYSSGTNYLLTTGPYVKSIDSVKAALQAVESVTINTSQGAALQHNTAYNIIKVTKNGATLSASDYRLEQGPTSYIRWNDSSYPGDNVVVTYYYTHEFENSKDYTLYTENNNHYLKWIGSQTPVIGEGMTIEYEKYLARKDTTYIDQYGNISVLQGIPADYGFEVSPAAPAYTLSLATIQSPPGGAITTDTAVNINVSNVGLTRFTMSDIQKMLKRIRTMEYDQTVLSLNNEAKEYGTDNKRGIFTDPFIDLSKVGLSFNLNNGAPILQDRPTFDTTIDLDSNIVYLPLISSFRDAVFNAGSSNVNRYNRTVTLRKLGETVVLSQLKATKSFLITPYLSYPQSPEIFIDPSLDTWYDDTIITLPVSLNNSRVVSSSTRNVYTSSGRGSRVASVTSSSNTVTSSVGVTTDRLVEENVIKEEAVTYIRPREINVYGTNYPPNLDNIKCYFEGVQANLTPTGATSAGTSAGSVRASSTGAFTAKFTIPNHILTGTRVVTLKSDNAVEGYETSAFTFYQATGTARTIQRTVTTITTVLLNRVTTVTTNTRYYNPDPLAQTFILENMTLLSGIDIYFENVPTNNVPVTCEIREVLNGNITSTVYGFKTLMANDIRANVSSDSSIPTRFRFNDPVLLESNKEYAFVLKSSSSEYRVFVAEIGETDKLSGELVLNNPYLLGVMMSSSNNSSWTNHQKSDVKFRLISDVYDTSSEILFDNIHVDKGFCRLCLSAESLIFEGNSIDWFYSIDGGTSYQRITPYIDQTLDQLSTDILLKARLSRLSTTDISPVLALDSVSLSLACYDNTKGGYYVSNLISGLDEYNTVEIVLDTYEPSGTSLVVSVSPSNNNASPYIMKTATLQSSRELNNGWFEKTYKAVLDSSATQCRFFIQLKSPNKYHTPIFRKFRGIMS